MSDALQRTAESLMEGLALSRAIVCSRYTWMARVHGLIAGWLVVLCSVLVPTRALAQGAEAPVVLRSDLAIRKVLDTGGSGRPVGRRPRDPDAV
jgi:hypothetical protein